MSESIYHTEIISISNTLGLEPIHIDDFDVIPEDVIVGNINNYGELNSFYGLTHTEETKKKISETKKKQYESGEVVHPLLGVGHSEETKKKLSEHMKSDKNHFLGKKQSKETVEKRRQKLFGKTHSEETKKHLSIVAKNRPKVTCPHCNKIGDRSNMLRWHFDNCRNK